MDPPEPANQGSGPGTHGIESLPVGAQSTLLITLYAKWQDAKALKPILGDRWAAETFEKLRAEEVTSRLEGAVVNAAMVAARALCLDSWAADFLTRHERATVLHLACGLDTRALRLQHKCGPAIRWVDLDFPAVVELRRQLKIPEPKLEGGYLLVGASVTESEWLEAIPSDRPVVVVFEGLTMYLTPAQGRHLIQRLADHFPSGELLFDVLTGPTMRLLNGYLTLLRKWRSLEFKWGVNNPKEIEQYHPNLKLLDSVPMYRAPRIEESALSNRLFMYVVSWLPFVKGLFIYLRFQF